MRPPNPYVSLIKTTRKEIIKKNTVKNVETYTKIMKPVCIMYL